MSATRSSGLKKIETRSPRFNWSAERGGVYIIRWILRSMDEDELALHPGDVEIDEVDFLFA
jgi:hypothetical protein